MAGGGSTFALPMLIFLGLDPGVANGTNRVGILIQNIFAVASFRRLDVHEFRLSAKLTVWALPGALVGALVGVTISDVWFQRILGMVMIGTMITLLIPQNVAEGKSSEANRHREGWIYPAMFLVGFYGGLIQVSVGFLFMVTLYYFLRMNLVYVNVHKVTIVMIYMVPALAVYALTGHVNWVLGLVLGAGSALGGWWAAYASVKGGERAIRITLAVAIFVMALKLLDVF